ncbi:MAG: alginate export family protein [Acidobacteria bacterium]|nr:alginate export family protein [Acidobacteriota bacterium]
MSAGIWGLSAALVVLSTPLWAEGPASAEPPVMEFGFEQRIRNENWNNILDFSDGANDQRNQVRYRTRVWANVPVGSNFSFSVGLNQETNQKIGQVTHFDEVVFETAYLDIKKVFVKGLSLRVGRQNLIRGEGFVFMEGGPGDGSRAIGFNAVNLAYTYRKSQLELIGIWNPREERFLPHWNDRHKTLQDWDEQAIGAYYTNRDSSRTGLEAYYFLKKEYHDRRPATNFQFQPDRHIQIAGGRVQQQLTRNLSATGEFAGEWGAQHPNIPIRAWGGYGYLKRTFNERKWKPYVQAGYWAMSGDDPKTANRIEGWDPMFARFPKWSELYIYSQVPEYGVAYWTNTNMWQGEAGFSPHKRVQVRTTYYHMGAFQPFTKNAGFIASGLNRGDMFQARVDIPFNDNWRGHVLYEGLVPGNFLRFEIMYSIKGRVRAPALLSHLR